MTKLSEGIKEMSDLSEELEKLEKEKYLLERGVTSQSFETHKDYDSPIDHPDGNVSIFTLIRDLQEFAEKHPNAIYHSVGYDECNNTIPPFLRVDKLITQTMIDDRIEKINSRIVEVRKRIKKIDTNIQKDIDDIDK